MDRRFTLWLLLTTSMCLIYLSMRQPPPNPGQPAADAQPADPLVDPLREKQADPSEESEAEISADPTPANPRRTVTLGSMDPTQGYNLLVSISSLGASVEKAELVEQPTPGKFKFRALEHNGGYLGYLGLTNDMQITTVPDGSAAAQAKSTSATGGLQTGDTLQAINELPVTTRDELEEVLSESKPGEEVNIVVLRGGQTLQYSANLSEVPLDILRTKVRDAEEITGNIERRSLRTTLGSLNGKTIPVGQKAFPSLNDTLQANWAIEDLEVEGGQGVQFRLPLQSYLGSSQPNKIDLVKRFRLLPAAKGGSYLLDVETVLENHNDQSIQAAFRQEGVAGLNLEGWWYSVKISPFMFSAAGHRDVMYKSAATTHQLVTTRQIHERAKDKPAQPDLMIFGEGEALEARSLDYIGLDSPYFNASLLSYEDTQSLANLRQAACTAVADIPALNRHKTQATNTSFWFDTSEEEIPAGGQLSKRYQLFVGPKDPDILALHGLNRAIEYGWFGWVAQPLSWILHLFYSIVGNYGIAIIMLTVVVRGLMFPLGRNAAASAQRMQELQPELKKINEKYKDNMEKRAKAMQDLYAKHNFKPLAGCLPMFIQLPIFMGLYRCLSVDISLRQEPLIAGMSWCSNLAGPDMLLDWSGWMWDFIAGKGNGWLGPYLNILPLVTVCLFIVQQKMLMPKATDEQTRMTQNMMQVMTIFMGVLFFKVPAGLCIYFITSSMWSLFERQLVKRTLPAKSAASTTPSAPEPPSEANGQGKANRKAKRNQSEEAKPKSRLEELKQMLDKPAVRSSTQRGSAKGGKPKKRKKR